MARDARLVADELLRAPPTCTPSAPISAMPRCAPPFVVEHGDAVGVLLDALDAGRGQDTRCDRSPARLRAATGARRRGGSPRRGCRSARGRPRRWGCGRPRVSSSASCITMLVGVDGTARAPSRRRPGRRRRRRRSGRAGCRRRSRRSRAACSSTLTGKPRRDERQRGRQAADAAAGDDDGESFVHLSFLACRGLSMSLPIPSIGFLDRKRDLGDRTDATRPWFRTIRSILCARSDSAGSLAGTASPPAECEPRPDPLLPSKSEGSPRVSSARRWTGWT